MSSKRGRKRNDNLPPNRARDVQRAFRARRAAHLQALEQRVSELEEENDCLRQALNLPPANRPPLGKGPTGKDKPKSYEGGARTQAFNSSRDSSSADADSPTSTRTGSLSPSAITASMPPRTLQALETASSWDQSLLMDDQHPDAQMTSASPTFQLPPMSAPLPTKPFQYPTTYHSPPTHSMSPTARHSISGPLYSMTPQPFSSQSEDRPISTSYGGTGNYMMRADHIREPPRQPDYVYQQSSYQSHDPNMHAQSPPATASAHSQSHPVQREPYSAAVPYPHRRSQTEHQYSIGSGFPHLPHPMPAQHTIRPPSPLRVQDAGIQPHPHSYSRPSYAPDGRLDTIS